MRGLFEKDIRIIKNQKKMMLIFAGMGVLLLLSGVEISFILPYMASVMTSVAISTISYDSMDNGNSFLFTLPVRRKDYATEKVFLCMRIRSSFRTDRSYRLWDSSAG